MTDDAYGSPLFAALRADRAVEWEAYVGHAFVAGLGDGTLPRAAFLTYLRQDYLFLVHFARAWALGAAKTDRIEEMRACAGTLHALIGEEMKLHIAICAREGIDEAALAAEREAPATLAYTRYVIDAGLSGDLLDLLVALSPCVMGYGEIGRRLAGAAPAGFHGEWIAAYADLGYQQVCRDVAALIETVAARRIGPDPTAGPRWPELSARFGTACRLEADFWSMGLAAG